MGNETGWPDCWTRRAAFGAALGGLAGLTPTTGRPQGTGAAPGAVPGADWPNQPVRYVNGFPPGGPTDTLSRLYCAKMSEVTGQQFVVENRSGSGGNVGVDAIAKSRPDGTTIGLGGIASHAIAPTLQPSLPFDPVRDFTFVTGLWQLPNMLVVNSELPAETVPELIALFRANPGKYAYGSAGPGTTIHLAGALFAHRAGVELLHVPYRGTAPAMLDLLAGRIHIMFDNIPGGLAQLRQGKVRALAVTGAVRSPAAPDIPTMAEFLPGYEIVSWTCLCAPAGLPPAMVGRMSTLSRRALEDPALVRSYLDQGAAAWWTTTADISAFRAAQEAALRPLILASGARRE